MKYSPLQAAEQLQCSVALVYALCQSKRLPHFRVGAGRGKILIAPEDIDRFLATARVGSKTTPPPAAPTVKLKHLKL